MARLISGDKDNGDVVVRGMARERLADMDGRRAVGQRRCSHNGRRWGVQEGLLLWGLGGDGGRIGEVVRQWWLARGR